MIYIARESLRVISHEPAAKLVSDAEAKQIPNLCMQTNL